MRKVPSKLVGWLGDNEVGLFPGDGSARLQGENKQINEWYIPFNPYIAH